MHSWVAISSFILLLTDAVVSDAQVSGVVGQPVTLPCTYSTANGVTTMCWGRGTCPSNLCSDELVWTDGTHVTFQKHTRYKLEGDLLEGNVSLTIENAAQADSGQYCCRVEHRGWFNDMKRTLSLEIKPAEVTRVPTSPRVFTSAPPMPAPTQSLQPVATSSSPVQTAETQPTTLQGTRTLQPTNSPLFSCPTDGSGTVTQSSDGLWHSNQTHVSLAQNPWMITSKGLYIGICIPAVVLLIFLVAIITKKYLCMRNKLEQLNMVSLNDPQIGALQGTAEVRVRAEDNIYIIEDNVYVME
ncbi:hepatitis A virus cellular receptor 1 isoform X1 [Manis pentadactyla]|uniref:hepatitis A virus cellular receptor 1 isoform X1 n=1 Tax=Manis pentadactyla TaxID=143292 RepID=UPI0018766BD0|nr:hepatitis A virus cellular receptor 1 isoform X1 [Manis pentadactyla]XP_036767672.1 hepatitis A virus cellular receptor 1 isoform X1 [Manis pentadactyla]XP_036767758.1 hepatitis A virus cellular receptor 1 isoform X1 [Manis pentadactyla]XP_036767841.1 hepatitis A virus cellular receptor 1 isoform X1 [Manis pentadactyla]